MIVGGEEKRRLFARIRGKTLLVAVGTGNDLKYLPPNSDIAAIDISPRMLDQARTKAARYTGKITLLCKVDEAQRSHTLTTTGLRAPLRHSQYVGVVLIMFGFPLQWLTLSMLMMFPVLATR